jgi:hypothetical protein
MNTTAPIPSASNAEDMVLAVYMPPQEPGGTGVALDAVEVFLRHATGG